MDSSKASLLFVISSLVFGRKYFCCVRMWSLLTSMHNCMALHVLCQGLGSGDSHSKSHRMISSFAEMKNLVSKWAPKINDMQIYEFSNLCLKFPCWSSLLLWLFNKSSWIPLKNFVGRCSSHAHVMSDPTDSIVWQVGANPLSKEIFWLVAVFPCLLKHFHCSVILYKVFRNWFWFAKAFISCDLMLMKLCSHRACRYLQ